VISPGRLIDVAKALRAAREMESHDKWDAERLRRFQHERLLAIVRHAAASSAFYRERFTGIELSDDLDPAALPTLDKATMLENFDSLVTDSRLNLAGVDAHLTELERRDDDALLLGEYRAMASGGTSGRRGVFVYSRSDWVGILSGFMLWSNSYLEISPRLPRRRSAAILADSPLHMTGRMGRSTDVGLYRSLRLDARAPLAEQVSALNAHRPGVLVAYSSSAAMLAEEQLAGRLRIAPEVVVTTSEVRTVEMEERIREAWGRDPFNGYASTETGFLATDCKHHRGLHLLSELVYLEVVNDEGRPVAPGEPGSRTLVTNLVNRTQPLIRFELNDLVTLAPQPCPCGRPHQLIETVDGRRDDILSFPGVHGGTVSVHPLAIRSPLAAIAALREYRVVQEPAALRVEAVLAGANGERGSTAEEIAQRLESALSARGARPPRIAVEPVVEIPRHPGSGKRRLIEVRTGA
jgi:putative adenylate-forming enzyme